MTTSPGPQRPGTPPAPQVPPTSDERTWAWVSHAGSFVGAAVAMAFLVPLVIMLVKGSSPFVRRHAVESLNFQITVLIYLAISVVLAFVIVGFFLLAALGILYLVAVILGTVRAANGEEFRYPLTLRLVS